MEHTFRPFVLSGLASTAIAFGAAAMMAAATAPEARADDFTDVVAAVNDDLAGGQAAFDVAAADIGSSNLPGGLAAFFDGVDDDLLSAPNNLIVGTIEAPTNEPIDGPVVWTLTSVPDFNTALENAWIEFTSGLGFFSDAVPDFSAGDYGDAVYLDLFGVDYIAVVPFEELLLGAAASF